MSAGCRVVGLIQTRDEWPLLALSISHALLHHVDEVFVLDHSSSDGTGAGLRELQEAWPGRLHVVRYEDDHFWQEACASTMLAVCEPAEPDWIYVFDADEFLLVPEGETLKAALAGVDAACRAVRYDVHNWVSTRDFDDTRLEHYPELRFRAEPSLFLEMHPDVYVDEIRRGNLNFFDVPFGSKLIFRYAEAVWLAAGSHALKGPAATPIEEVRTESITAAHLPFLSRRRLDQKIEQGNLMVLDRFPTSQGWQSQLLWAVSREGRLEEFWRSHSVASGEEAAAGDRTPPTVIADDALVLALAPVLSLLEGEPWLQATGPVDAPGPSSTGKVEDQIAFRTAVHAARRLQLSADAILRERDALLGENRELRARADECDSQLSRVGDSASWRVTRPLRWASRTARRLRARGAR